MNFAKAAFVSAFSVMAAASPAAAQQLIAVPGVTIIVGPSQAQPDAFQMMNAQMAQMNAMMQQMDAQMSAQMAALPEMGATPLAAGGLPAGVSGVAVTTISDGSRTCTARVVYPAGGGAQKVEVSEAGNACAALHFGQPGGPIPSALPAAPVARKAPGTIVVENAGAQKPMLLADRD